MMPKSQHLLMRPFSVIFVSICVLLLLLLTSCVDSFDQTLRQNVNIVVVDGTITNLAEPQVVRLNRSKSDSLTGRFGTLPITKALVEVIVDSGQVVTLRETSAGRYQAPDGFRGQIGHSYQLRFTLIDGFRYQSNAEVMPAVPPITKVSETFNPTSLPAQRYDGVFNPFRGANELSIDWQDPANQHNYYRWDWKLWEKQDWCHTCNKGFYYINNPYNPADKTKYEDCTPSTQFNSSFDGYFVNDYTCRTACWEIIRNFDLNIFDDQFSNGGLIQGRKVAQIPYYQDKGCLVEIRQSSSTAAAYRFNKLAQEQTQNNGGIADTPPTALVGNVHNVANRRERIVGYFTASAVAPLRYWLDRKQNTGRFPGLFVALNGRLPSPEGIDKDPNDGKPKPQELSRPLPTAVCVDSDTRTPNRPQGWQD